MVTVHQGVMQNLQAEMALIFSEQPKLIYEISEKVCAKYIIFRFVCLLLVFTKSVD